MRKEEILVAGTSVEVWWKRIKNMNLAVYGPHGRVRISVPSRTTELQVQQAVLQRMGWIRKQQARFQGRPVLRQLQAVDGELHLLWGNAYPLHVDETSHRHSVSFAPASGFVIHVRPGKSADVRLHLLQDFYRLQLQQRIPDLLKRWESRMGIKLREYRIKRMKTRWGTCNIQDRRVWLNLELAKKPERCLEYILVHEMVHLLERSHNRQFYAHMDRLLPDWRSVDALLKEA